MRTCLIIEEKKISSIALLYITFERKSNSVIEILKLLESVKNDKLQVMGDFRNFYKSFTKFLGNAHVL